MYINKYKYAYDRDRRWLEKPKIFTIWLLTEKVYPSLNYINGRPKDSKSPKLSVVLRIN